MKTPNKENDKCNDEVDSIAASCSAQYYGSEEDARERIERKISNHKLKVENLEKLLKELPKGMSRNFYSHFRY